MRLNPNLKQTQNGQIILNQDHHLIHEEVHKNIVSFHQTESKKSIESNNKI